MSFIGEETYSIDSKGRVNIPAKMRKYIAPEANDTFIVTLGFDNCIVAYPLDVWNNKYKPGIENLDPFDPRSREFRRKFLRLAEEVKLDGQQRVAIPRKLSNMFKLENKVTIVGQMDYLEFWRPEVYENYLDGTDSTYEEVAANVMVKKKPDG